MNLNSLEKNYLFAAPAGLDSCLYEPVNVRPPAFNCLLDIIPGRHYVTLKVEGLLWNYTSLRPIKFCYFVCLSMIYERVLRRIFGPKRDEVTGGGENCIMRSFICCTLRQV
jgi:hypothetical protein